ncbi:hypothetical protein Tco_0871966 [Tanacetum coccineum]
MESLNSNFQERELHQLQQMQDKAKESCMISFRLLHSHLKALSNNDLKGTRIEGCFEWAFVALFDQDVQTFTGSMLLNLDQLEQQLDKEGFQETRSMDAFRFFLAYTQIEVRQFRDILIQHIEYVKKSIEERALHTLRSMIVNERKMQSKEGKDDSRETLDAHLVVTESNETESETHVSSSRSGNDTHAEDTIINSENDKQPMAKVQLSAEHNILANEQQHSEQSESIYNTYLLEKVDRNTTPDSADMSHGGGEIDQNAEKCQVSCPLVDPSFDNMTTKFSNQFLESENISLKKTVAQLQKDLSRMETHSNIKREINVLETRNIDLESSMARLLAENKKLNKENEHLKQTYKDLFDSKKKTSVQTKDHADSLIVQLNCKLVENADLKAQIQEKMASEHSNSEPALHEMTPAIISSGLVPNLPPSTPFVPPSRTDWDILFQLLFDELLTPPPSIDHPASEVVSLINEVIAPVPAVSTGPPSSTIIDQDAPSPIAHMYNDPFFGVPIPEVHSDQSSSTDIIHTVVHLDHQISEHNSKCTKDHPLENIIGELDRPVSTRLQLHEQDPFCYYDAFLATVEPKTYKDAGNGYLTKRRKTKQKSSKQDTRWKSV